MKKLSLILIFSLTTLLMNTVYGQTKSSSDAIPRTIFAYGGELNPIFINYVISLTRKKNPKICFIPTALADNANYINYWYELCLDLPVKPSVLRLFINSSSEQKSFEEYLLQMDAIIVGGGNTLNMMAIWKAQGIDTVLRKAYEKGIILAGGSAGSLCWFTDGITDSRPQKLSLMQGLGFINASNCTHYTSEKERKPLYESYILKGEIPPGYASDDLAGMLFLNEKFVKAVSLGYDNNVYFVSTKNGQIDVKKLETEIIK